jgi:hypothetical protein
MRCTIVDTANGMSGCVPLMGSLMPYDACPNGDADCPRYTWCDARTRTCAPFCSNSTACKGGTCVVATGPTGPITNGFNVCTAHCNPETAAPCGAGATCGYDPKVLDFDCFLSGGHKVNDSCKTSSDCSKGLVCGVDQVTMMGSCFLWCTPTTGFGDCPTPYNFCSSFSPPFNYQGAEYGYCN